MLAREPSEKADDLYAALLPKLKGAEPLLPREAAALEFAQRLATEHTAIDDAFMAQLRETFSDAELVELGLATAAFLALGRLHHAFGVAPMTDGAHHALHPEGGGPPG